MKLYLKGARLAFTPSLFEAKQIQQPGGTLSKPKFSCVAIIEPTTLGFVGEANPDSPAGKTAGLQWKKPTVAFSEAIISVAKAKWGEAPTADGKGGTQPNYMVMVGQLKAQNKLPLHDGGEKATVPGFAGNFYCNASSDMRPVVRNRNGAALNGSEGVVYPGCYGDVVVDVWAQSNQHGKRVNSTLMSVTFSHDGERLAGGATASQDDYAAVDEVAQEKATTTGAGAASLF